MPVVKAKEGLEGHWWLTSEGMPTGGKALKILDFQPFLVSNVAFVEGMKVVIEV